MQNESDKRTKDLKTKHFMQHLGKGHWKEKIKDGDHALRKVTFFMWKIQRKQRIPEEVDRG